MCPVKPGPSTAESTKKKKKADCMRIGPFYRNDTDVRDKGQPYTFRAVSPFVCPDTLRLLHPNVPSVNYARYVVEHNRGPDIPAWAHSQLPSERAIAAALGRAHSARSDMLARWAPCMPEGAATDDDFWCAVYRMEWLETLRIKLMAEPRELRLPRDAIMQVVALQDMNQMRLILMETHCAYTREQCVAIVGEAAYDVHYGTSLASVMHWGMLPDLASIHANLPFWDKPTETFARMSIPFDHDEVANTLVHIFTKVIFQPSKMRELNKCLFDEITRMTTRHTERLAKAATATLQGEAISHAAPAAIRFIMMLQRLIFCSLGGYYPHSEYIPSGEMRRELYRRFMFDVMTLNEFKTWVIQNKRLMTIVLRENHIYNLSVMPGIEGVFDALYEYRNIRNKTLHAMETVRRTIDMSICNINTAMAQLFPPRRADMSDMRSVHVAQFALRCAMLSNIGDVLWVFSTQFSDEHTPPALRRMLMHMFWRATPMHEIDDLLCKFSCAAPVPEIEYHLRMVVLYWLIMRDRCDDQSMKKTALNYKKCVDAMGTNGVYLLPPIPSGSKKKPKRGVRRAKSGVACDAIVSHDAAAAERFIVAHMTCARHDGGPVDQCKCLGTTIRAIIDDFDIYRFLLPKEWATYAVQVGRGIEQYMWNMYDACLGWCYRPRQTSFAEEIVSSAGTVCNIFTSAESLAAEVRPYNLANAKREYAAFIAAHAQFKLTRNEMRAYMTDVANSLPPDAGISFEWAAAKYKIDIVTMYELDDSYKEMMGESHHKSPSNAMLRIARTIPRDFFIIRLLYKIIHRRESIRVYPMWGDLARRQIAAIHAQTNAVLPGAPLPATLGRVYYCPAHCRILAPVVGADFGKRGHVNTYAVGTEKVVVNPVTNEKFCGVRTGRIKRRCVANPAAASADADIDDVDEILGALPRRLRTIFQTTGDADADAVAENSDEEYDGLDPVDPDASNDQPPSTHKSAASDPASATQGTRKRRSKKRNYTRCGIVPAESVNMIGVMFMLYNTMYMLCPFCGHVMRYGRDKFSEIGVWCGACVRGEEALAHRLGIPWDELNECADPYMVPDAICGVPVIKTDNVTCYYCGEAPPSKRPLHYHLLYNDLGDGVGVPPGMVYIGMCEHHAKWWIGWDVSSMRLSTILHNFRQMDAAHSDDNPVRMRRVMPRTFKSVSGTEMVEISLPFEEIFETTSDHAIAQHARESDHRAGIKRKRAVHSKAKAGMKAAHSSKGKGKKTQ